MLKIKNLTKHYGKFLAVNNLELEVKKGEIFGFVGPNGAGKTTTMKIICGLLAADSGEVQIDGIDIFKNTKEAKEQLGYMPDFFGVYDDLKVHEYLDFFASIYKVPLSNRPKLIDDLLELVDLKSKKYFYVDSLSRGMKQRLCLARCLVHNPKLLVLDEPASGMDPRARVEMKEILRNLRGMGKTILVSSHILSELSELCTSIGIIDRGNIVIAGSVSDIMKNIYKKSTIKIRVKDRIDDAKRFLLELPLINSVQVSENILYVDFDGEESEMSDILKKLILSNIPVLEFYSQEGNLEDVFMKVTREDDLA